MRRYAIAIWTAIWAAAGIVYAVRHGGAPVWMFTVAAVYAVLAVALRDRWRAKYLAVKATRPRQQPLSGSVRLIREDSRPVPPPRDPPGDETQEWPGGGPWQPS